MKQLNKTLLVISTVLITTQLSAGYLGLNVQNLPAHVRAHLPDSAEITKTQGVIVDWLEDISPAADDGIKLYDILLSYNKQAIESSETFIQKVKQDASGHKVTITLVRQGQVLSIPVTLSESPKVRMTAQPKKSILFRPKPTTIRARPAFKPQPLTTQRLNIAGKPAFPMRKKPKVHAWGTERNIWPDFYTDSTGDMWDNMINAPFKMGRMPGGWRAPSMSMPDPVTIGDAVTNQLPPMAEEVGNMLDISN